MDSPIIYLLWSIVHTETLQRSHGSYAHPPLEHLFGRTPHYTYHGRSFGEMTTKLLILLSPLPMNHNHVLTGQDCIVCRRRADYV